DKFSSILPAYIIGIGAEAGGYVGARLQSLLISVVMLFFFYKFSLTLLENKTSAVFALIFFAIQAPVIFISKYASSDIISLTFFTAFLWVSMLIIKNNIPEQSGLEAKNNIRLSLLAAVLYLLALASNYLVILFAPAAIIIYFMNNKKASIYFTIVIFASLLFLYLLFSNSINEYLSELTSWNQDSIKISKLLIRIAEYIAIPVMLIVAALQMIWKTRYKSSLIYTLLIVSLIIPVYIIVFKDIYNIYRLISFSLIFLAPTGGMILAKFIQMNSNYKYSAIFALYFVILISFWHISKLENSYPNTDTVINYCNQNLDGNSVIYCENPFLLSANFYPGININNFKNLYYDKQFSQMTSSQKTQITSLIQNGNIDYVVLNGMIHPEFSENLKSGYLPGIFVQVLRQEYNCNSLMYPNSNGNFEIYKLKSSYKRDHQYLANKEFKRD
ncbi:hypothetical protein ACFLSQ_12045, partial [Bacteroidota bacterium]